MADPVPPPKKGKSGRYGWGLFWLLVFIALVVLGFAIANEVRTSKLQAREFSRFAAALSYSMHDGPSDAMRYPGAGPFDQRLGYSSLGDFLPRLLKRDYLIAQRRAPLLPELMSYSQKAFSYPIRKKSRQAFPSPTVRAARCINSTLPQQLYSSFASIPPLVVHSLLFIENRDLLDPRAAYQPRGRLASLCHGRLLTGGQATALARPVRRG